MKSEINPQQITSPSLEKDNATEEVLATLKDLVASSIESSPQRLHEESKEEEEPVESPGRVENQNDAAATAQDTSAPLGVEGAKYDNFQPSPTDEASLLKQISKSYLVPNLLDSLLS